MATVQIHASTASGQTLAQLADIVQERMRLLNETAKDSIAACMLNVLRSLRTIVLVAKPKGIKVNVARDNSLQLSYTTRGNKRVVCLRVKGSNVRYTLAANERFALAQRPTPHADKIWQVYRFTDDYSKNNRNNYIVAAPNSALAKQFAKDVIARRIMRYAGLAKKAISTLMQKTFNSSPAESVSPRVAKKAYEITRVNETIQENKQSGGTYTLTLYDDLLYATNAFRGGSATVDTQLKKAMNKIVATINRRIPDGKTFFGPQKIPTPFPELKQRRKK